MSLAKAGANYGSLNWGQYADNLATNSASLPDDWVKINTLADLNSAIATYGNNPAVFLFAPVTIDCTTEGLIDFGDNKYLLGVGSDTTILQNQTTTGTNPNFRFGDRNVVQNMTFDYKSVTGTTETQPLCYTNSNCSFQNVQFQGIASGTYELVRIDSSAFRVTFQDCIFTNVAGSGKGVVMVDHDGQVVKFVNCYFESFGSGTQLLENGASTGSVLLNNCYFTTCVSSGVMWDFANNYFALTNCFFRDCTKIFTLASTVRFSSHGNLYEGTINHIPAGNKYIQNNASAPTTVQQQMYTVTCTSTNTWIQFTTATADIVIYGNLSSDITFTNTTNPKIVCSADSPPAIITTHFVWAWAVDESTGRFNIGWFNTTNPSESTDFPQGFIRTDSAGNVSDVRAESMSFVHEGGVATYRLFALCPVGTTNKIDFYRMDMIVDYC